VRAMMIAGHGLVLTLTLTGCHDSKITDATDPQAQKCKAVLASRINAANVAANSTSGAGSAQAAIANSLAGPKPKECDNVSDELGAKLLNQLAAEATARAAASSGPLDKLRQAVASAAPSESPTPTNNP
jgi:hypothetical protein